MKMTPEQRKEYDDWLASVPNSVRKVALKFPIWKLYRMKSTGQIVFIFQYDRDEDDAVTLTVVVTKLYDPKTLQDRQVFGISVDDLEDINQERDEEKEDQYHES